jgi:hypothetical protein
LFDDPQNAKSSNAWAFVIFENDEALVNTIPIILGHVAGFLIS